MSGMGLHWKASALLACLVTTGCATRDVQQEVPDFVLQHTLSTLTSEQSFSWEEQLGEVFVIQPLGTFRDGDRYCRDYKVELRDVRGLPSRRTACRVNDRWVSVDPSDLDL